MIKKISALILSVIAIFAVMGCNSLVVEQEPQQEGELPELTLEGDYLCGFHLTFSDSDGEPISGIDHNFESDNAVKFYVLRKKYEDSATAYYFSVEEGEDVFLNTNCEQKDKNTDNNRSHELKISASLPFTYELIGGIASFDSVYMKNDTYDLYTNSGLSVGLNCVGIGGLTYTDELAASRTNMDGTKETLSYKAEVKVEFYLIDYLTGVTVHEYDANNRLIISNEYVRGSAYAYSKNCAYMVLEEHYEVMHETDDFDSNKKGTKYSEYTLINPANYRRSHILQFPRGNGLIEPDRFTLSETKPIEQDMYDIRLLGIKAG